MKDEYDFSKAEKGPILKKKTYDLYYNAERDLLGINTEGILLQFSEAKRIFMVLTDDWEYIGKIDLFSFVTGKEVKVFLNGEQLQYSADYVQTAETTIINPLPVLGKLEIEEDFDSGNDFQDKTYN